MSASLVGSEMCIRDSPKTLPGDPSPCPETTQQIPPAGRGICWGRLRATAVSYTHLTLPTICSV
eukprot:4570808-Alexandrium_andersonii.AAC.1